MQPGLNEIIAGPELLNSWMLIVEFLLWQLPLKVPKILKKQAEWSFSEYTIIAKLHILNSNEFCLPVAYLWMIIPVQIQLQTLFFPLRASRHWSSLISRSLFLGPYCVHMTYNYLILSFLPLHYESSTSAAWDLRLSL